MTSSRGYFKIGRDMAANFSWMSYSTVSGLRMRDSVEQGHEIFSVTAVFTYVYV